MERLPLYEVTQLWANRIIIKLDSSYSIKINIVRKIINQEMILNKQVYNPDSIIVCLRHYYFGQITAKYLKRPIHDPLHDIQSRFIVAR